MKEQEIQKQIIDYLTIQGWLVWKNKNMNRTTGKYLKTYQRGVPDLTALNNGRVIFIEVKTNHGEQSSDQIEFENKIREHDGEYYVIRSIDEFESQEIL